jgi:hypothetical protein
VRVLKLALTGEEAVKQQWRIRRQTLPSQTSNDAGIAPTNSYWSGRRHVRRQILQQFLRSQPGIRPRRWSKMRVALYVRVSIQQHIVEQRLQRLRVDMEIVEETPESLRPTPSSRLHHLPTAVSRVSRCQAILHSAR